MSRVFGPEPIVEEGIGKVLFFAETELESLLTRLDPWAPHFGVAAWEGIGKIGIRILNELENLMPGRSMVSRLQQAWSVRFGSRVHISLLYRAGLAHQALADEAARLHEITLERWRSPLSRSADDRHRGLVNFLMASDPKSAGIPDLGPHTKYRGSIRLRYRVAHHWEKGTGLTTLLQTTSRQPAATSYQRRVELGRAVRAAHQNGRGWQKLNDLTFTLLTQGAQELVFSVPHLWPMLLTPSLSRRPDFTVHATDMIEDKGWILENLIDMMKHVRDRRLDLAGKLISRLPDKPLVRALGRRLRTEPWGLGADFSHISAMEAFGPWQPMSQECLNRLQPWCGAALPPWWAQSADELASIIISNKLEPKWIKQLEHTPQDLSPLRRSWSISQQQDFIRGGHVRLASSDPQVWNGLTLTELAKAVLGAPGQLTSQLADRLKQLPDASPWLNLMAQATSDDEARRMCSTAKLAINVYWREELNKGWSSWIVSSYGCEGWESIESIALTETIPIKQACRLYASGQAPVHPAEFRRVVARSLYDPEKLEGRPLIHIKRWLKYDPLAAATLVEHGPSLWVERLVANISTPLPALDVFIACEKLSPVLRRRALRNRISRTSGSNDLIKLSSEMPPDTGRFKQLNQWMLSGAKSQQAYALVLTARHDGSRLFELFKKFGEDVFRQACQQASELLKTMAADPTCGDGSKRLRREAAALELLIHLGAEVAPSLMQATELCKIEKPMGYRADVAYRGHRIPKKNGGERLISVPHPALSRSQRFILDRLLTPLGVHDCAFGFVPGRSIADNAKPHVGQLVVVNADIRNCFPSVRMHLVRDVLQNRLGSVISAEAIELLLDLTITRAALPVGAPTSPALLNLVLFEVDDCLQRGAEQLGGRYTRYADDLTFSGGPQVIGLLRSAQRAIGRLGLELDPAKTNIFRRGRRQMVTGLVVNDQVAVPRAIRRRLRAAVHRLEKNTDMHWSGQSQSIEELRGRLAFVAMACKPQALPLINRLEMACTKSPGSASASHSKKGHR